MVLFQHLVVILEWSLRGQRRQLFRRLAECLLTHRLWWAQYQGAKKDGLGAQGMLALAQEG